MVRSLGRSLVLAGLFAGATVELLRRRPRTRPARADWLHGFCGRAIERLGVRVETTGVFPERGAVICNHLGYVDIVVFAAMHPCVFVAKAEMEGWPLLGWMTKMAGTVFVARGRGGSAAEAGGRMRRAAESGLPIVFFPEGTTSNGDGLLPFHGGLLGQAMLDGQPVTAAALRYRLDAANGTGVSVADDVAFWGERAMLPHIFRFLGLRGVVAEVQFAAEPIRFSAAALANRKVAAAEARAAVMELLTPPAEG